MTGPKLTHNTNSKCWMMLPGRSLVQIPGEVYNFDMTGPKLTHNTNSKCWMIYVFILFFSKLFCVGKTIFQRKIWQEQDLVTITD